MPRQVLSGLTNLITNPSFEVSAGNWPVSSGTIARVNTVSGLSGWSAKLTSTGGDTFTAPGGDTGGMRLGMLADNTYTLSCYLYVPTGGGASWRIKIFDNDGSGYVSTSSGSVSTFDSWVLVSVTRTLRAGATQAFVRVENNSGVNGDTVYIDNAQLTQTPAAVPYFDGSTGSAQWSGAPHLSTSVQLSRTTATGRNQIPTNRSVATGRTVAT
jgi:hypothetical protein